MSHFIHCHPGLIHGDANEANIIVVQQANGSDVAALIDWEDSSDSHVIYDLASEIAYLLMLTKSQELPLFQRIGRAVTAGFCAQFAQLSEAELQLLPVIVACRYTQSLLVGYYFHSEVDPHNPHMLKTAQFGWLQLPVVTSNWRLLAGAWIGSD